jgi:lipid II:glycine glycyltransferase (peptidoglycan interpeptide bridge formation enzyme)
MKQKNPKHPGYISQPSNDTMNFILSQSLSEAQLHDVLKIYYASPSVSIEQFPGFSSAADPDVSEYFLLAYSGDELHGYACVKIKKRILAWVIFGPVVKDFNDYEAVCKGLIAKCRNKGVWMLRILPPYMSDAQKAILESTKTFKYEFSDEEINWCSLRLPLDKPMEETLKGFSENHRRSIKKAQKLNLSTSQIESTSDIDVFSDQYVEMFQSRGLPVLLNNTRQIFQNLFSFFHKHDNGIFLVVRSDDGGMVGGLSITYQGNTAFYFKGYSHPDHRNLPINHLAFYNAMTIAKERGVEYFDFGGYANNVKEGDQLYAINRFKDGFGGKLITHPRTRLVYIMPGAKTLYKLYRRIRKVPV